jgi:hypothetical protein
MLDAKISRNSQARVAEIGEILAAGLMRALARKSSQIPPSSGETSLDISPAKSGHPASAEEKQTDG